MYIEIASQKGTISKPALLFLFMFESKIYISLNLFSQVYFVTQLPYFNHNTLLMLKQ